jgi:hypothetical protein
VRASTLSVQYLHRPPVHDQNIHPHQLFTAKAERNRGVRR